MKEQPSEALEAENAAYVWLQRLQIDLVEMAQQPTTRSETHLNICWAFERYRRAYERHATMETARIGDARRERAMPPPTK